MHIKMERMWVIHLHIMDVQSGTFYLFPCLGYDPISISQQFYTQSTENFGFFFAFTPFHTNYTAFVTFWKEKGRSHLVIMRRHVSRPSEMDMRCTTCILEGEIGPTCYMRSATSNWNDSTIFFSECYTTDNFILARLGRKGVFI